MQVRVPDVMPAVPSNLSQGSPETERPLVRETAGATEMSALWRWEKIERIEKLELCLLDRLILLIIYLFYLDTNYRTSL